MIRDAAAVIRAGVRECDLVARVGGDELVVLCVESAAKDAPMILERLAEGLANANQDARPAPLGWSCGFAVFDPVATGGPSGLADLMAAADAAMYTQKLERRTRSTP